MITITKTAAAYFKSMLEDAPGKFICFDVTKTGCSGWSYKTKMIALDEAGDALLVESNGLSVYLTPRAQEKMAGTEVDVVGDAFQKKVVYNNPKAKGQCGCGESFSYDQ